MVRLKACKSNLQDFILFGNKMLHNIHEVRVMGILEVLREEFREIDKESGHDGYWYRVSNVLIMMVCGMLCGLHILLLVDAENLSKRL